MEQHIAKFDKWVEGRVSGTLVAIFDVVEGQEGRAIPGVCNSNQVSYGSDFVERSADDLGIHPVSREQYALASDAHPENAAA